MKDETRRAFLQWAGAGLLGWLAGRTYGHPAVSANMLSDADAAPEVVAPVTLFLCGDVMTGRGIDQVLPHSVDPRLHEPYVQSARRYVELAEAANGPIPRPVDFDYPWGEALEVLDKMAPDLRLINLETAVTTSDDYWKGKGIHYRMHPRNIPCLTTAKLDGCVLANNHVLDWGYRGLEETLTTLHRAGLATAGAGRTLTEARAPAAFKTPGKGRVLVFGFGHESSGVPPSWAAGINRPGVNYLEDFSDRTVGHIAEQVRAVKQEGNLVVASVHWGGNWGYRIPPGQRRFAHRLIDEAGVDVVHGHSSHHPKGIEVYRDRPILYGCGDFLNDYEGIEGYEQFRDDLTLMYFPTLDPASGRLLCFSMVPMQIRRFRLHRASDSDARWLAETLDRESRKLGCRVILGENNILALLPCQASS